MTMVFQRSLRTNFPLYRASPNHIKLRNLLSQSPSSSSLFLLRQQNFTVITSTAPQNIPYRSQVNGPLSTLPAPLETPTRRPDQSTPSYLLALGKSFVKFYKSGAKAIYANFQASRQIQKTLDQEYGGSLQKAIDAGFLDRSKFQLLFRSWYDTKRVPVFALVFAICGEFTPLVVVFLTNAVPSTCRIPKQVEGVRRNMEHRRAVSFRNLTIVEPKRGIRVENLERMQLLHISWSVGLSSSAWDWLGGRLPGLPTSILRKRVKQRVEYLDIDDQLIESNGGVEEMEIEEVRIALMERGVDVLGKTEEQLRNFLQTWLHAAAVEPIEKLLLTRPSIWPSIA